jgi:hypothetical protein
VGYQAPDRSVLDAIKATAERIERLHFEALSPGIGLGNLRPRRKLEARASSEAKRTASGINDIPITFRDEPLIMPPNPRRVARRQGAGLTTRLTRRLIAHALDLLVIALTLVIGSKVMSYVLVPPEHVTLNYLRGLLDIEVYRRLGFNTILAIVYFAFGVYWVFFKIFAGLTLGESMVGEAPQAQPHGKSRKTKASRAL